MNERISELKSLELKSLKRNLERVFEELNYVDEEDIAREIGHIYSYCCNPDKDCANAFLSGLDENDLEDLCCASENYKGR